MTSQCLILIASKISRTNAVNSQKKSVKDTFPYTLLT